MLPALSVMLLTKSFRVNHKFEEKRNLLVQILLFYCGVSVVLADIRGFKFVYTE